jgi:hypothetical protein
MRGKINSIHPKTSYSPDQTDSNSLEIKRSKRKFYAIVAVIAVTVLAMAFLIPRGLGNSIPLNLKYQVGEKMIYNTKEQVKQNTNAGNITSTSSLEVIDFDGEFYTLNRSLNTNIGGTYPISYIEKVNKTGYASYFLPGETEHLFGNTSSNPVLAALLSKPEAKIGDTWEIPLNTGNLTIGTTGKLALTFRDIEDLQVPAGTYKVFRIDISSNDLTSYTRILGNTSIPEAPAYITTSNINVAFNGQLYLEYGTCRQIKSDVQIDLTIQSEVLNYSISCFSTTTLTEHIKP